MKPKPNRLILRAAMVLLMMVLTTVTEWAETETVSYIDADGNQQSVTATILTGSEVSVHGLDCRVHGLDYGA